MLARLLEALWDGPYLMGDRVTVADVMVGASLTWGRQFLPDSPVLDAYVERLMARPAKLRADARDGEIAQAGAA